MNQRAILIYLLQLLVYFSFNQVYGGFAVNKVYITLLEFVFLLINLYNAWVLRTLQQKLLTLSVQRWFFNKVLKMHFHVN